MLFHRNLADTRSLYLRFVKFIENLTLMKLFDKIPKIWKRAYGLICLWYFINFAISAIIEWQFVNPAYYVLWNAFFLYEALCFFIIVIFVWSHALSNYKPVFQVAGHVSGIILFFQLFENNTVEFS